MVEHRAVPDPAYRERRRCKETRARSADGPRGGPGRADSADADQSRNCVADGVSIERKDLFESDRNQIEQAAIEVEVLEMEHRLIGKPARVIGDDELAVALLDFLIVGDRVIAKGEGHEDDERAKERRRRQVVTLQPRPRRRESLP